MTHTKIVSTPELMTLAIAVTRLLSPEVVLEVGAREAMYLRALCDLDKARLVAFEASPANFDRFHTEVRSDCERIEYLHRAVADRTGSVTFKVNTMIGGRAVDVHTGRNSIMDRATTAEFTTVEVPCTSVDAYFNEIHAARGTAWVAWIDVEGATGHVLQGLGERASGLLAVHVEVETKQYWRDQWLASQIDDFFTSLGMVLVARDQESRYQYNCIYVRSDQLPLLSSLGL